MGMVVNVQHALVTAYLDWYVGSVHKANNIRNSPALPYPFLYFCLFSCTWELYIGVGEAEHSLQELFEVFRHGRLGPSKSVIHLSLSMPIYHYP